MQLELILCRTVQPGLSCCKNDMNPNTPNLTNKNPIKKRRGFGTLEVVIIIAVLLSVALIFRAALTDYANHLIQTVLGNHNVIDDLADDNLTS